jgi:tetratricopeptide (TPR) repeat protein
VPLLRAESPELAKRLAACFFWVVVEHGYEEDAQRYRRVFGAPPEDPLLHRLAALAQDAHGDFRRAHYFWLLYEKSVAQHADAFPPGRADQIRALVWRHLGKIAARDADVPEPPKVLFRLFEKKPPPVEPDAETCFRRAIELAPDQLAGYKALLDHLEEGDDEAAIQAAAERMLQRFPDNVEALQAIVKASLKRADYYSAVEYLTRLARVNAIDSEVRGQLGLAHICLAGHYAANKKYAMARESFQTGLALCSPSWKLLGLCYWSSMEKKVDNEVRGEELLNQARDLKPRPLVLAYALAVAAIQVKSPAKVKAQFEEEFKEHLKEVAIDSDVYADLLSGAMLFRRDGIRYTGRQKHEKLMLDCLKKFNDQPIAEPALERICLALPVLQAPQTTSRRWCSLAQRRFPHNPIFYIAELQCELSRAPKRLNVFRCGFLVVTARGLAEKLPAERRDKILPLLASMEAALPSPGFSPFDIPFGDFSGGPFEDDDDF